MKLYIRAHAIRLLSKFQKGIFEPKMSKLSILRQIKIKIGAPISFVCMERIYKWVMDEYLNKFLRNIRDYEQEFASSCSW